MEATKENYSMETNWWLARTETGTLYLFPKRPLRVRSINGKSIWTCGVAQCIEITDPRYNDITFSNSPQEVAISLGSISPEPVGAYPMEI